MRSGVDGWKHCAPNCLPRVKIAPAWLQRCDTGAVPACRQGKYNIGMRKIIAACCLSLACLGAHANPASPELNRQVAAFIDEWHDDAAHARMAYFDKMSEDGVYIGTDKTENWKREEFRTWAKRAFQRPVAWAFKATQRNIYASPDGSFIWFDELLDTQMGPCQASGVIRKTAKGFEIVHYQLSMAVPNEVAGKVTALIKAHEAKR